MPDDIDPDRRRNHDDVGLWIGDYVEGYTSKSEVMNAQWDEFDTIVAKLQMPFF